jgi:hypothetical protein
MLLLFQMSAIFPALQREAKMGNLLKVLVAAACLVIIGGGAVYAWGKVNNAMKERQFKVARDSCIDDLQRFYGDRFNSDLANKVNNCVFLGFMSHNEVYAKLNPKFD